MPEVAVVAEQGSTQCGLGQLGLNIPRHRFASRTVQHDEVLDG